MKPGPAQWARLDRAMSAFHDFKEYGLPESGGSRDQPALWHHWMRTIKAAVADADEERG